MQILQVFFLQDLQDLALYLASLALKMKLFLQDLKNLARKNSKIIFLQDLIKFLQENLIILQTFLARFLQHSSYLARKASFLVQDLQDLAQGKSLQHLDISCKTVSLG